MECTGYSETDPWRKECCKLNMQLSVSRCVGICTIEADRAAPEESFNNVADMMAWLNSGAAPRRG